MVPADIAGSEQVLTIMAMLRGLVMKTTGIELGFVPVSSPVIHVARKVSLRMFPRDHKAWCFLVQEKSRGKCTASWKGLGNAVVEKSGPIIRTCHAGLRQTCFPIRVNNRIVGMIRAVSAIPTHEGGRFREALASIKRPAAMRSNLLEAYHRLPGPSEPELSAIFTFCARIIESALQSMIRNSDKNTQIPAMILSGAQNASFGENSGGPGMGALADTGTSLPERIQRLAESGLRGISGVDHIATTLKCPASTVRRTFKKSTGMSIPLFLNRLRIEKAKQLLARSALPASGISIAVGYRTVRNFNLAFKKETGLAPLQYRSQMLT